MTATTDVPVLENHKSTNNLFQSISTINTTSETLVSSSVECFHQLDQLVVVLQRTHSLCPSQPEFDLLHPLSEIVRKLVEQAGEHILTDRRNELNTVTPTNSRMRDRARDALSEPEFIEAVLRLVSRLMKLYMWTCQVFSGAIRKALSSTMNGDAGRFSPAMMLAAYIDNLLKGKFKRSEQEKEESLERCMLLFTMLSDKDVFAEVCRQNLSRRLLSGRSTSSELEKLVVCRMKSECGVNFTGKLVGMLTDVELAKSFEAEFVSHLQVWKQKELVATTTRMIDFSVKVFNTGFWPAQRTLGLKVPPVFEPYIRCFEDWYRGRNASHRLKWELSVGDAVVAMSIGSRKYDLVLSTPQAFVLCLFDNRTDPLTVSRIREESGFTDTDTLHRVLASLIFQKEKNILLKEPMIPKISETDVIFVNKFFHNRLRKFRIPLILLDDTNHAADKVSMLGATVNTDRKSLIQAAIVRLMKSRKILSHNELVAEVIHQLITFQPQKASIKFEIEKLIEKEYITRSNDDQTIYQYLP
eukprot:CAMPEP_0182422980 /NCGR_PEP_ID=MMETSP1167-20130531/8860_1 /TAXON_ID=2988 /ORGANISM="Mallomonas Sp, Strain CCMP3275" /LENGTH=526 /DNA_ID=CAMNT_0024601527 /DNA_START=555 /DNA_END=2135 /DNA_ORIENTATION=+